MLQPRGESNSHKCSNSWEVPRAGSLCPVFGASSSKVRKAASLPFDLRITSRWIRNRRLSPLLLIQPSLRTRSTALTIVAGLTPNDVARVRIPGTYSFQLPERKLRLNASSACNTRLSFSTGPAKWVDKFSMGFFRFFLGRFDSISRLH